MTATVEELAPRTEDEVRAHLAAGKLVEGLQHMSPEYLKGIRRILTVSADTELVSAPAYLRAAAHAPALNNFGSAVSIIQDELAHAHIGYRLLGDLGVDMSALIYEREAKAFKYPYAFDVPLDSWYEMVLANALYDQAGFVLLSDVHQSSTFGPWKRALAKVDKEETFHLRHGRTWVKKLAADPQDKQRCRRRWTGCSSSPWSGSGCRTRARSTASSSSTASRASPTTSCARTGWVTSSRSWRRSGSRCRRTSTRRPSATSSTRPSRRAFDSEAKRWGGGDQLGRGAWSAGRAAGR